MKYIIYDPGGNKTAFVIGDYYKNKKEINDIILSKHKDVEQVGFISTKENKLTMAGGEFCGNATRCAAYYYLKGKEGTIKINVSGTNKLIMGGVDNLGNAFSQIPHLCW
jgi:histidine racemase